MTLLRSLAYFVWLYGSMIAAGLIASPMLLLARKTARKAFYVWLAIALWGLRRIAGVSWEVRGRNKIPPGAILVASKHQSMFDTMIVWTIFDDPAIMLKRELLSLPVFSWWAVKLGNITVDREGGASALRAMLREAQACAEAGRQVLIFPEGTRTEPGEAIPYKTGVALLYRELGLPCLPVALNSGLCWPAHGVLRRPGHIIVEILDPIPPGLAKGDFMAELERRIEAASKALLPEAGHAAAAHAPAVAGARGS